MRILAPFLVTLVLCLSVSCQGPEATQRGDQAPLPEERLTLVSPPFSVVADAIPLSLPYVEVEAESAPSSGSWPASSTTLHTAAAEASGRRYAKLAPGERLSIEAPVAGDSLVIRYSFPDAASGGGRDGTLKILVGSQALSLAITSRRTWEYGSGNWGTSHVWHRPPSAGSPRHFWDEAALRTPAYAAGTPVVVANPVDAGVDVLIDLVDFELVPAPVPRPMGSVSLADFHPAADGVTDDTAKLQQAIAAAGSGVVYLPEGTYKIGSVDVGTVTLQGAGMWRTRFVGKESRLRFNGGKTHLADFAIFGDTNTRDDASDAENGLSGNPASGTVVERLWIEHKKCAFWVGQWNNLTGPSGLTIAECRFRNLMADAVNLCSGTTNTVVQDCLVRGTGDDGLAAWSPQLGSNPAGGNNSFLRNFVQLPWLASGIALYGGGPFIVDGNVVADTVTTGSGLYLSANFSAWPFTGNVEVKNNTLIRAGAHESDAGGPTGAIRVLAADKAMTGGTLVFTNNTVVAQLESAVSIQGPFAVGALTFTGLTVTGPGAVVDVRSNAQGSAVFANISLTGLTAPLWRNSAPSTFALTHP